MNNEKTKKVLKNLCVLEAVKFNGIKNIVDELVNTGKCVTTISSNDIWVGGVGNFITTSHYDGGVDLFELKLNEDIYVWSEFINIVERKKVEIRQKINDLEDELKSFYV